MISIIHLFFSSCYEVVVVQLGHAADTPYSGDPRYAPNNLGEYDSAEIGTAYTAIVFET